MEDRTRIPDHVKEKLRREVGYGCPICRSPFLTWHHFDPPYNIRPHNDPEGMIALCSEHHNEADNDNWSPEQLRAWKQTQRSVEDVKGSFPSWEHENILVRLGGNYTGGSEILVAIEDQPLLRFNRNDAGLLSISFDLLDIDGTPLLHMVDNVLEMYPKGVHDFIATAKKREVKLWLGDRDIGLDLTFERLTLEELAALLSADFERCKEKTDALMAARLKSIDPWQRQHLQEFLSSRPSVPTWIDNIPPEIREQVREGFMTGDNTGAWVKNWARKTCIQGDGKIPFLNFKNLSFFFSGKRLRIRDGIAWEGLEIAYSAFFQDALGAINLPAPAQGQVED